jgi:hypothetical protein
MMHCKSKANSIKHNSSTNELAKIEEEGSATRSEAAIAAEIRCSC